MPDALDEIEARFAKAPKRDALAEIEERFDNQPLDIPQMRELLTKVGKGKDLAAGDRFRALNPGKAGIATEAGYVGSTFLDTFGPEAATKGAARRIHDALDIDTAKALMRSEGLSKREGLGPDLADTMLDGKPDAARAFLADRKAAAEAQYQRTKTRIFLQNLAAGPARAFGVNPAAIATPGETREQFDALTAERMARSTGTERFALGASELLPAVIPIGMAAKGIGAAAGALGAGKALAGAVSGPLALGAYSGAIAATKGEDVGKAALGGAAMGALAGAISAPLSAFLSRLEPVKRSAALARLASAGEGALSFAGADAILHGPNGERLLQNALFGAGFGLQGNPVGKRVALGRPQVAPIEPVESAPTESPRDTLLRLEKEVLADPKAMKAIERDVRFETNREPTPDLVRERVAEEAKARYAEEAPAKVETPASTPASAPEVRPISPQGEKPTDVAERPGTAGTEAPPVESVPRGTSEPARASERGAVQPAGVMDALGEAAGAVKREFGSMIGRVESFGGEAAKETAAKARQAVDASKEAYGAAHVETEAAQRAAGKFALAKGGKAARSLADHVPVEGLPGVYESRLHDSIERKVENTPDEAAIVQPTRNLLAKWWDLYNGVRRMNRRTGEYEEIDGVSKGDVAPRIATPEFTEIVMEGPSSRLWRRVVDATAKMNGIPREKVEAIFNERREGMLGEGKPNVNRPTQLEFGREFERVPSAIRDGLSKIDLLVTDPYEYVTALSKSRANRLGVIKAFGQDIPGEGGAPSDISRLRAAFADQTGKPKEFTKLLRALHGVSPAEPNTMTKFGRTRIGQALGTGKSALKMSMLTTSAAQNVPETIGNKREFAGTIGSIADAATAFKEFVTGKRTTKDLLRAMGSKTTQPMNIGIGRHRPIRDALRAVNEFTSRFPFLHGPVNEGQETSAGRGALRTTKAMAEGRGFETNRQRLLAMGRSWADATRLAEGKGTPEEYAAIVREAPGRQVGANLSLAEQSNFENRPTVKAASTFNRYAMTQLRDASLKVRAFLTTMDHAITDTSLTRKQRFQAAVSAVERLGSFALGKTVQGSLGYLAATALIHGPAGVRRAFREAEDDIVDFALRGLASVFTGGPIGSVLRATSDSGSVWDTIFPVAVAREVGGTLFGDAKIVGNKSYANLDFLERVNKLANRFIPIKRAAVAWLGSPEANVVHQAEMAYWKWANANVEVPSFGSSSTTEFRTAAKKAFNALRNFDEEDAVEAVRKAMGAKDKDALAKSLRTRTLLNKSYMKGHEAELRKAIGEEAYRALQIRDKMITDLISTLGPGQQTKTPGSIVREGRAALGRAK